MFNIADSAIVVGVIGVLILTALEPDPNAQPEVEPGTGASPQVVADDPDDDVADLDGEVAGGGADPEMAEAEDGPVGDGVSVADDVGLDDSGQPRG